MARLRLHSLALTGVAVGLVLSLGLAGCGSSGAGNGRGEKVTDLHALAPDYGTFGLAASGNGTVALAWIDGSGHLNLSELKPDTWHWSKPEVIASSDSWPADQPEQIPLAYDGSGRLLVAWTTVQERNGPSDSVVTARIREADGKWEPAEKIARGQADGINVSSGKRSFALGWYNTSIGSGDTNAVAFPNVSGFRILKGSRWLPSVHVGAEGEPIEVQFVDHGRPFALWTLPIERKLMYASLQANGTLSKPRKLSNSGGSFSASFDANQAVAGWYYNHHAWASVWNGRTWTKPKKLGQWSDDSGARSPIATTISRGRAAVVWTEGWAYALWQHGEWTRTYSMPSTNWGAIGGWGVNAASLRSSDIFLAGFGGVLQIVHARPAGGRTLRHYPINEGGYIESGQASASSARAVALAWSSDIGGFGDNPNEHLFVWVYRS
ncbi:MAG: hypothetical protein WBQ14_04765 [Gaiellaceae bacterium]